MKNNNKNTSLTAKEYELLMTFNDLYTEMQGGLLLLK